MRKVLVKTLYCFVEKKKMRLNAFLKKKGGGKKKKKEEEEEKLLHCS